MSELQNVDVSLILVSYNDWKHLGVLLEQLRQERLLSCEIIIVDNASQDGAPEHIEQDYPEFRLVRNSENKGFSQGCNLGASLANGRYLAFLNQDTRVESGWLDALIETLESNQQAGMATSKILLMSDPEKINTCGNIMHITGVTSCYGLGQPSSEFSQVIQLSAISGASFLIKRELFEKLGGFDEDFFMYVEDTDLSLRVRLLGKTILLAPTSRVYHDYSWHSGPLKIFYQERNRYWMLLKCLQWPSWLILMPAFILAEVVVWGFVLITEPHRWRNKLRAYRAAIENWPRLMEKRRQVQAGRQVRDRELLLMNGFRLVFENRQSGRVATLAHWIFDPLFWLAKGWIKLFLWW